MRARVRRLIQQLKQTATGVKRALRVVDVHRQRGAVSTRSHGAETGLVCRSGEATFHLRQDGLRTWLAYRPQRGLLGHLGCIVERAPMPTPTTTGGQGCEPARTMVSTTNFSIVRKSGKLKISSAAQRPPPSALGEQVMST